MEMSLRLGLPIAAATLAVDQARKWWLMEIRQLDPGDYLPLIEFGAFRYGLTMVTNEGVFLGLLDLGSLGGQLALIAVAATIVGVTLAVLAGRRTRLASIALGLLLGGTLSTIIDRLRFGGVIDFAALHIGSDRWFVFNLADVAVMVGLALIGEAVVARLQGMRRR